MFTKALGAFKSIKDFSSILKIYLVPWLRVLEFNNSQEDLVSALEST